MTKTAMREIVREIREVLRDTETAITNEDGFLMYDCLNDIDYLSAMLRQVSGRTVRNEIFF